MRVVILKYMKILDDVSRCLTGINKKSFDKNI
jgi:hypothetical protein